MASFFNKLKENTNSMFRKVSNDTNRFFNKSVPSVAKSFIKGVDWVADKAKQVGSNIERQAPMIGNVLGGAITSFGMPEVGMLVSQAGNRIGAMGNQYGQIGNKLTNTTEQLKMIR